VRVYDEDLVRVYDVDEGVADKDEKKTPVAFFAAPSIIQSLACAGDKIAVGLQNGGMLHLRAAFLAAGGQQGVACARLVTR
jgi:hypothetical protein